LLALFFGPVGDSFCQGDGQLRALRSDLENDLSADWPFDERKEGTRLAVTSPNSAAISNFY
jgi:hypothetical protein